jgi:hypothetical protein
MPGQAQAGTGSTTGEAPLGMVSLAAFGLVLFWVGARPPSALLMERGGCIRA